MLRGSSTSEYKNLVSKMISCWNLKVPRFGWFMMVLVLKDNQNAGAMA